LERTVISLGGSILVRGEDDASYLRRISGLLRELSADMHIAIVTGGGRTARAYIDLGRSCGANEAVLDEMGIAATRLNAYLLISALGTQCYPRPFSGIEEAISALSHYRMVIGGGTHPGHTTDTVAALLAERWEADAFLNLTSVPGAFTSDPATDPRAKRLESITTSDLVDLVDMSGRRAGANIVIDPLAARVLHRSRMKAFILHGRDIEGIRSCISGGSFEGTVVVPDGAD